MVIGHLLPDDPARRCAGRGPGVLARSSEAIHGATTPASSTCRRRSSSACDDVVPPPGCDAARGLGAGRRRSRSRRRSAAPCSTRRCPSDYPFVDVEVAKKQLSAHRQRPRRALPEGPGRRDARRPQGGGLPLGHPRRASRSRSRTSSRRRARTRSSRATRSRPRRSQTQYETGLITDDERRQELIEIWTQATNEVAEAMEANFPATQPGLDDGPLRRPRKHDAGPADRRHAWSRGQPQGRDHPAADQGQLPRGPVRARVLHLDARCPQGSGRHRAADRRLRLPHPSSGRRLAGRDHPRGRLRHRPWPRLPDRGPRPPTARSARTTTSRPPSTRGPSPTTSLVRQGGRGRRRRRHHGARSIDELVAAGVDEVKVRSVLTCESKVGTCATVLRPLAGHRQARRRRRGGRHHRRPVDRRARHPADHAYVPHRRRRR